MATEDPTEPADNAGTAQETIAAQAHEIGRLRRQLARNKVTVELRDALMLAASTGIIATPTTHDEMLHMIIETAARLTFAESAFLFLIDRNARQLVFQAGYGPDTAALQKLRLPLGQGIAGLVALSGEPMAVSDTAGDPRLGSDVAQALGYVPRALLCVPMFYEHRITGVLELLDKNGENLFTQADLEILGLFANQAAVAIEQSRTHRNLSALLGEVLTSVEGLPERRKQRLQEVAAQFAEDTAADIDYQEALDLAELVREIAWYGDEEFQACKVLLQGFADYVRARRKLHGLATGKR